MSHIPRTLITTLQFWPVGVLNCTLLTAPLYPLVGIATV
jgi:hypothetical protein